MQPRSTRCSEPSAAQTLHAPQGHGHIKGGQTEETHVKSIPRCRRSGPAFWIYLHFTVRPRDTKRSSRALKVHLGGAQRDPTEVPNVRSPPPRPVRIISSRRSESTSNRRKTAMLQRLTDLWRPKSANYPSQLREAAKVHKPEGAHGGKTSAE